VATGNRAANRRGPRRRRRLAVIGVLALGALAIGVVIAIGLPVGTSDPSHGSVATHRPTPGQSARQVPVGDQQGPDGTSTGHPASHPASASAPAGSPSAGTPSAGPTGATGTPSQPADSPSQPAPTATGNAPTDAPTTPAGTPGATTAAN
jgi:hypothetical protein